MHFSDKYNDNIYHLKHQSQSRNNVRVYIFTNNQGPKTWAENKNYIEAKIHYKLF